MRTVFTPDALARSKFKTCRLSEWRDVDGDELFYFRYPSPNLINQENGDGDLMEVIDFAVDLSSIDADVGFGRTINIKTTPETLLYYR